MKLNSQAGAAKSGDPKPGEPDAKMIPFEGASLFLIKQVPTLDGSTLIVDLNRNQINGRPASPGSGAGHYPYGSRSSDWVGAV